MEKAISIQRREITLIKSILSSLLIYVMSLPIVLKKSEIKIRADLKKFSFGWSQVYKKKKKKKHSYQKFVHGLLGQKVWGMVLKECEEWL